MIIKNVEFVKSAKEKDQTFGMPEVAFVGRSNVGKSSLINYIINNKIAKVSSTPGRTRLINYFKVNGGQFMLVDLPGYGFAKGNKTEVNDWSQMMEGYFANNENLKQALLLLDIRHDPSIDDLKMQHYLMFYNIPYTIIATKCDKLSKSQVQNQKFRLASKLKVGVDNIICESSTNRTGAEQILSRLDQFIGGAE